MAAVASTWRRRERWGHYCVYCIGCERTDAALCLHQSPFFVRVEFALAEARHSCHTDAKRARRSFVRLALVRQSNRRVSSLLMRAFSVCVRTGKLGLCVGQAGRAGERAACGSGAGGAHCCLRVRALPPSSLWRRPQRASRAAGRTGKGDSRRQVAAARRTHQPARRAECGPS